MVLYNIKTIAICEETMSASLDIIIGPMFSGKSSELIRRIRRARIRKKNIIVIKPKIDSRYHESKISTHDGSTIECINLDLYGLNKLNIPDNINYIAIDEAQFFTGLYDFVNNHMEKARHVLVAGLNGDYKKDKFGEITDLIPIATRITKLSAVCSICGKKAHYTYRKSTQEEQILIGESDIYEARCYKCWKAGKSVNIKNIVVTNEKQ